MLSLRTSHPLQGKKPEALLVGDPWSYPTAHSLSLHGSHICSHGATERANNVRNNIISQEAHRGWGQTIHRGEAQTGHQTATRPQSCRGQEKFHHRLSGGSRTDHGRLLFTHRSGWRSQRRRFSRAEGDVTSTKSLESSPSKSGHTAALRGPRAAPVHDLEEGSCAHANLHTNEAAVQSQWPKPRTTEVQPSMEHSSAGK